MENLLQELKVAGLNPEVIREDLSAEVRGNITLNYASFITKMACEIGTLLQTEERLSKAPENADEISGWKMEVSSFLKELGCPITFLYEGELQDRLHKTSQKLAMLDFLLSTLLSARMEKVASHSASLECGGTE